jgi:hypothetical protein
MIAVKPCKRAPDRFNSRRDALCFAIIATTCRPIPPHRASGDYSLIGRSSRPVRPDPLLQRFLHERLFERGDADPLGALLQEPAGDLGDLAAGAMEGDEAVRVDGLAGRGNRAEAPPIGL